MKAQKNLSNQKPDSLADEPMQPRAIIPPTPPPDVPSQPIFNAPYISPTPGAFPIMAENPFVEYCPDGQYNPKDRITEEALKTFHNCGFNVGVYNGSKADYAMALSVAESSSVVYIAAQGNYDNDDWYAIIEKYLDNPKFVAWLLRDEPCYSNWHTKEEAENIGIDTKNLDNKQLMDLRPLYEKLRSSCPSKMTFLNLIYGLNDIYTGDNKTYYEYLEKINEAFLPAVWCYDYYPITGSDENPEVHLNTFYESLQVYSDISKATNRPFWCYIMSVQYDIQIYKPDSSIDTIHKYPFPTVGMLRFQAFTALAYGAQGLIYWFYSQRCNQHKYKENENNEEKKEIESSLIYISAPIDRYGNKTEIWDNVRRVNVEIDYFSEIFLNCKVVKVERIEHLNDQPPESLRTTKNDEMGPFSTCLMREKGCIASHIISNGVNYIVIVSQDPFNELYLQIAFKNGYDIYECVIPPQINKNGNEEKRPIEKIKLVAPTHPPILINKTLIPGGYLIYEWHEKEE